MKKYPVFLIIVLLAVAACSSPDKKSPSMSARDNAVSALSDSVKAIENQIQDNQRRLSELSDRIGVLLQNFTTVNNPREVEGYTILSTWKSKYPLQTSGIAARIRQNEGFEIVAANVGSSFSSIRLSAKGRSVSSNVVAHDQAMNYRRGNMTTVAFQGALADSIGFFVKAYRLENITLSYLEGEKQVGQLTLSGDTKEMIAATWDLYMTQREIRKLENQLPLLSRKAQVYQLEMQRLKTVNPDSVRKVRKKEKRR